MNHITTGKTGTAGVVVAAQSSHRCMARRRNIQKEWFSRTGLDALNRQRTSLMADKHRIEREMMELMIGPDKAAIDA